MGQQDAEIGRLGEDKKEAIPVLFAKMNAEDMQGIGVGGKT